MCVCVAGAACIEQPVVNSVLSWHMARALRRTVRAHAALRGLGEARGEGLEQCRTVRQFDAAFTAQHFGFKDVDQYYRAATLADKLHHIKVKPLLIYHKPPTVFYLP